MQFPDLTGWTPRMLTRRFLSTPFRRILFAIAFSLLIHVFILWWPNLHLRHDRIGSEPLSVILEHADHSSKKSAMPPSEAAKVHTESTPSKILEHKEPAEIVKAPQAMVQLTDQSQKENKSGSQLPLAQPAAQQEAGQTDKLSDAIAKLQIWKSNNPGKFPKNILLSYSIYGKEGGLKSGDLIGQFQSHDEQYSFQTVQKSNGPLELLGVASPVERMSRGTLSNKGLRPDFLTVKGKQPNTDIVFDWSGHKFNYADNASSGRAVTLPDKTQDSMSLLFQLRFAYQQSFYPRFQETIPISVLNDNVIEQYDLEIGAQESIDTPLGKIRALHLRRLHPKGEPYYEIWLGVEDFMLPVKFHTINSAGEAVDEFLISDIRVSDE